MENSRRTVRIKVNVKVSRNRSFVFASRMGRNINVYPIKTPIQAVKNQDMPSVYTAQVNKSRQIDRQVETEKTSSFFDSKKQLTVGTNVQAQRSAANTTKNQESVWFTAKLQMKQVKRATAQRAVGTRIHVLRMTRNFRASCFIFLVSVSVEAVINSRSLISRTRQISEIRVISG